MNYLTVDNFSKSWSDVMLFSKISFTINQGNKIALIAKNGTGKTSLMNILMGSDISDEGKYEFNKDISIGYLKQDPQFNETLSIFEFILDDNNEITRAVKRYEKTVDENDTDGMNTAIEEMNRLNAWDYEARFKQVLNKLRITNLNQPISQLSGGQKKRLALASVLINEPNLLIMDEPTNHLDLEMIEWLEGFLKTSKSTLFMVTHDRYFLDRVCNEILEIDDTKMHKYHGNYTYFLEKREQRIQNMQSNVEKAQNLMKKELEWMRKMPRARGTKAKYRVDAFYDLKERASQKIGNEKLEINIESARLGQKILEIKNLNKKFENLTILDDFTYTFQRFEKLGIIGDNGSGKSTFLNIISGLIDADSGEINVGQTIKYGYYKQDGMQLKEDKRVIEVIQDIAEFIITEDGSKVSAGQYLRKWMFPDHIHHTYVSKLSGGEKRRLYLMTVLITQPNFLILDEPTNDLDLQTLNVLEDYLLNFQGCVIIVSHDRFFMDKVVDHLFVFQGSGVIKDFAGNYTQYRDYFTSQEKELKRESKNIAISQDIETPKAESKTKKVNYKDKIEYEKLTREIEMLENEKAKLESEINNGIVTNENLTKISHKLGDIIKEIDTKTDRWIGLGETM